MLIEVQLSHLQHGSVVGASTERHLSDGLAHAASTREQVRMRDPIGLYGVLERLSYRVLPDDLIERLRPVFPC